MGIDKITEINKNIDHIEHVEKFNPFHDSLGRFATSSGFASYSANPKTKAGANAINRSFQGGHGRTMNVHRESKGESITQNARWLATGQKPAVPASVSRARYQQRKLRQQQAQQQAQATSSTASTQAPKKPATPKAQTTNTQPQTNGHTMAQGKDISSTFTPTRGSKKQVFDQVCEQQGFTGKPQLVDRATFHAAEKASGVRGYRTWHDDYKTGTTAQDFKKQLSQSDDFEAAGGGGRAYGGGTYIATNPKPVAGTAPSRKACSDAWDDSRMYGGSGNKSTATVTLDPSAKIGDYSTVTRQFYKESPATQNKFRNDVGAYAAAKGYDGLRAVNAGWQCDYVTVYNRSKLIVLND